MKAFQYLCLILIFSLLSCHQKAEKERVTTKDKELKVEFNQYITVLGTAQDAGFPQIHCKKACCNVFYNGEESKKLISCLGLVDRKANKKWLFDATPDVVEQLQTLNENHLYNGKVVDGVFLTHAHIGHYTGLMMFGREAMTSKGIPVYTMPRMKTYLQTNGPWSQLVALNNIELRTLQNDSSVILNSELKITPLLVPHRDEYSETVGYRIEGKNKSALFIPDIDKWEKWDKSIIEEVKNVDYAFLDATFFKNGEISRPMNEVPHPFIQETVELFKNEPKSTKRKIYFIHFNHTNPALKTNHRLKDSIMELGFSFAKQGDNFSL